MNARVLVLSCAFVLSSCITPAVDRSMKSIESVRPYLNKQVNVAIWYTEYEESDEYIRYANEYFSEIFGITVDEILEKKRYHLVNPPDTPADVIEQYKDEDKRAMEKGSFLSRAPFEEGKDIVVVKLRFDHGMLGLFQIVDTAVGDEKITLQDLDAEILDVVRAVRPDLFK